MANRRVLPVNVRRAMLDQNREALSKLAQRSVAGRQRKKRWQEIERELKEARTERDFAEMRHQSNEDLCPVDD